VISRVKNVIVQADGVAELAPFYERLLGQGPEFTDGDRWAQFRFGGSVLALAGEDESFAADRRGWTVTFEVDDLEAAEAALAEVGGTVRERRDMGDHGRAVVLSDPVGNLLVLWARAAPEGT
jgi:predicted enzyme related to lactoylglutathione lyase